MGGAASDQALSEAYDLIEAEKHDEAQAILEPILEAEPDNVDAWWLYAHAVTDPEAGRMALNQVLRLDSSYQEAQELLATLDDTNVGVHSPDAPGVPASLPEDSDMVGIESLEQDEVSEFSLDDTGPIFDDRPDDSEAQETGRSGLRIALTILVLLAILVVVAILVFNPFAAPGPQAEGVQTPGATSVAQQAAPAPLSALPSLEPVSSEIDAAVSEAMADFNLIEGGIGAYQTSLGKTLLASVCTTRETLRDTLNGSMEAIAAATNAIPDDFQAVGIALVDCNADKILRIIATSSENATAFSTGEIDSKTYEAGWVAAA